MSHDNIGTIGDSRVGQQQAADSDADRVQQANAESSPLSTHCSESDASIIDASKREDKLVDAAIKQAKVGQGLSFVLNLVFTALSFVGFVATGSLASFGFMSVPVISVGFNIWKDSRSGKGREAEQNE